MYTAHIDVDADADAAAVAGTAWISARQHVSPRWLVEPGPSPAQLECLFAAAAAAPDHGQLLPWRFVVVPAERRHLLAEVFALALLDRDAESTPTQIELARAKAHRAPWLALAVTREASAHEPEIPNAERLVSLGAALQNLLLAAQSMRLGSGLTSGQAIRSERMRQLFKLEAAEQAVCFVNVGTVGKVKPKRTRPSAAQFVSSL